MAANMNSDYRAYQASYMSNNNGTTALEVFSVIYPVFLNVYITTIVTSLCLLPRTVKKQATVLFEFCVIVIPIVLIFTILADIAHIVSVITSIVLLILVVIAYKRQYNAAKFSPPNAHFVTNARATINILSAICILAVDFRIFPKRFAKTETYGYSLMDVGVGLYVYSNGIVAPEVVQKRTPSLLRSVKHSVPLLLIGWARFSAAREANYHVPVSEYGTHWNFFLTLAATKLLSSLIFLCVDPRFSYLIGLVMLFVYEYVLQMGLAQWVLGDAERTNFFTSNREGIVSTFGYVGLYFLSISIGKIIFKYHAPRKSSLVLFRKLFLFSFVFLCYTLFCDLNFGVSRRLANVSYCFWVLFIGVFMTFLYYAGEVTNNVLFHARIQNTPVMFEAVNYNGLAFFLIANVLTGIINVRIKTLHQEPVASLVIIILYMLTVCYSSTVLYMKHIKLKM